MGAKKLDRISRGLRDCVLLGAIYSVIAFVVIYFFSDVMAHCLFVDRSLRNGDLYIIPGHFCWRMYRFISHWRW